LINHFRDITVGSGPTLATGRTVFALGREEIVTLDARFVGDEMLKLPDGIDNNLRRTKNTSSLVEQKVMS
jgi:hypothetical protein